ncbi:glycogen synthase 1 [Alsobacter metallidurans]|uniref:Glycogen synthase n=1 Tax=Alsobacter metallidurans TaxID=340221 RepID=A0A917MHX2_9HYPH|nr:glycogen synthase 1 [Alsobacter metallidurans]
MDVRILIPGYRELVEAAGPMAVVSHLPSRGAIPACSIGKTQTADGLPVYVLLCPELYDRAGSPYGDQHGVDWVDNDIRFARLSLAAAEIAGAYPVEGWRPDLLHVHDWPAALAPAYLAWNKSATPCILTVHNLAHQGLFPAERMDRLGIPSQAYSIDGVEFHGKVSFLKAGLYYANHITTVSETYAHEITTREHGCGLEGLLRDRSREGRLTGILNGIDESWDPYTDPHLAAPFAAGRWRGKAKNADSVRKAFGLAVSRGPLFAVVSRLVPQKGVDLTIEAAESIVRHGGQIVVTGRGEAHFEKALTALSARHPGHVGISIGFEEKLARRIYAGSDFLLMPSRFEPCGLSQMYAQRFGSLPVARATGGLAETIEDGETGFLFETSSLGSFLGAVYRAFDAYRSRARLAEMRRAAMACDRSWANPAQGYARLFGQALNLSKEAAA